MEEFFDCLNSVRDPITGRWVIIATDRARRPRIFPASR